MSSGPSDANIIPEIEPHNSGSDAGDTVVVAVIPKNKSDNLVVSLCRYKGHKLVDVRVYGRFNGITETRPTRKGVCLNVTLLPALIAALNAAVAEAHRLCLLPQAGSDDQPPVNGVACAKDRTAAERQRRRRQRLRESQGRVTGVTVKQSVTAEDAVTPSLLARNQEGPTPT